MNSKLLEQVEKNFLKTNLPEMEVGDTVEVSTIIREGGKVRTQKFKGLVLGIKGSGARKTVTVRKISYGIGVEKIFPIHSPNVSDIALLKKGRVRQSKIYYMRDRVGKKAMKVKEGEPVVIEEGSVDDAPVAEETPAETQA